MCVVDAGKKLRDVLLGTPLRSDDAFVGSKQLSGLRKDVINVMPLETVAVDFTADNASDTMIHCHRQPHMDFGFMQIIEYNAR
jgi:FtsP/CotA-like multicopper oxidase with cupredoxin domain